MAEIRTTSSTGGQKGVKPERLALLPRRGVDAIARVFGFGATKYADHNWRRGYEWSKSFDALFRHAFAALDGETYDEESGLPHLAHAGFHVLVLLTWLEEQGEGADNPFDDRWPAGMERARRALEAEKAEKAEERRVKMSRAMEWLRGAAPEEAEVLDHPAAVGPISKTRWIQDYDADHPRPEPLEFSFDNMPPEMLRLLLGDFSPARFIVGVEGTEDIQYPNEIHRAIWEPEVQSQREASENLAQMINDRLYNHRG